MPRQSLTTKSGNRRRLKTPRETGYHWLLSDLGWLRRLHNRLAADSEPAARGSGESGIRSCSDRVHDCPSDVRYVTCSTQRSVCLSGASSIVAKALMCSGVIFSGDGTVRRKLPSSGRRGAGASVRKAGAYDLPSRIGRDAIDSMVLRRLARHSSSSIAGWSSSGRSNSRMPGPQSRESSGRWAPISSGGSLSGSSGESS
jgi:hypothetical protein